jgi:hypothetical protein
MENLSQDLVDRISSFLYFKDLKNSLLLSRSFQYVAERCSEVFRIFDLTTGNADKLIETYSGRRFRYLRNLHFSTNVPAVGKWDGWKEDTHGNRMNRFRDTAGELQTMDEDFIRQTRFLFSTLHTLGNRSEKFSNAGNIHLTIITLTTQIHESQQSWQRTFVS